jgi:hypothetical protein
MVTAPSCTTFQAACRRSFDPLMPIDPTSSYHTSAVLAAMADSCTLPYRLSRADGTQRLNQAAVAGEGAEHRAAAAALAAATGGAGKSGAETQALYEAMSQSSRRGAGMAGGGPKSMREWVTGVALSPSTPLAHMSGHFPMPITTPWTVSAPNASATAAATAAARGPGASDSLSADPMAVHFVPSADMPQLLKQLGLSPVHPRMRQAAGAGAAATLGPAAGGGSGASAGPVAYGGASAPPGDSIFIQVQRVHCVLCTVHCALCAVHCTVYCVLCSVFNSSRCRVCCVLLLLTSSSSSHRPPL